MGKNLTWHRKTPKDGAAVLCLLIGSFFVAMAAGETHFHWNSWQPWVCMCDLHKQARIRHFVVWAANITLNLKASEFWQEKACALDDCFMCTSEECPSSVKRSGFLPVFQGLSSPKPHEVEIPLPVHLDFPSYDSLPVVDDTGENEEPDGSSRRALERPSCPAPAGQAALSEPREEPGAAAPAMGSGGSFPAWLLVFLVVPPRIADAAPSQGSLPSPLACKDLPRWLNKPSQRCCYRCPKAYSQKTECPTDLGGCEKRPCQPDHYLNEAGATPHCEPCVTCMPDRHLVEKLPCSPHANRVCQCQSGWYCTLQAKTTCVLCVPLTTCKPGFGVKNEGTSDRDTVCQECPPGTFSDQDSRTQTCKPHTDCAKLNKTTVSKGTPTHDEHCLGQPVGQTVMPVGTAGVLLGTTPASILGRTTSGRSDEFNTTHVAGVFLVKKTPRDNVDLVLLGAGLLCVLVLLAGLLMLRRRRACKAWIVPQGAKCEQTFCHVSNQVKICGKRINGLNAAESSPGEGDPMNPEPLAEAPEDDSSLETERAPVFDPDGAELVQMDGDAFVEAPLHNHTSNRIEKIYIMRADTVIVGSVSEAPSGKICPAREEDGDSRTQEGVEGEELAVHYPEQETEFYPGSDITTPVEEEWEFCYSSEKPLDV
ncbi:tumor necrosis factor receptor superfamily member 8 [Rhineura floridana]|uniref:tumor necrosis factor receptor superfamily member 8 n=1 Tax=Rhineura floridana TaxID=261503 RepID=UPI002AC87540|nr:tumor necrosis factor receptor superfamily member 8 [Rhineura floridana]